MDKRLLGNSPFFNPAPRSSVKASSDKGQTIMEGLLLNQYQNSPLLQEYYMAFIAELDYLFEQVEEVYYGRFIEQAVGRQLDIIGIILDQPRAVALPTQWFGFSDAGVVPPNVAGMADEATPAEGGLFRDENQEGISIVPLDDPTYRRVLYAIAIVTNRDVADISLAYYVISVLLGRVPSVFELRDQDSGTGLAKRTVELVVSSTDTSSSEVALILYMKKYFIPSGITFIITEV